MPTVAEILTMLMAREGLSDNELAERTGDGAEFLIFLPLPVQYSHTT